MNTSRARSISHQVGSIGWRKLENTFGFCEESRLEMAEGVIFARSSLDSCIAWDTQFVMGGRPGSSRRH